MTTVFNLTPYTNDFVNQFDIKTEGFINFFNKMALSQGRMIKGTTANVELAEDMTHEKHAEVSSSTVTLGEVDIAELKFEATKVSVSYQDIQDYGVATAIQRKDDELLFAVSDHIEDRLIGNMATFAENKITVESYKQALAKAKAQVQIQRGFKGASTVAFVNTEDYYDYLADSEVATAQNLFGMDYVENFLGYSEIFFSSKIERGKVYVTARNNMNLAYIPATGPAFTALQLTSTENNLIGVKHVLNDNTGDIDTFLHFGLEAFAERVDAVVEATITEPVDDGGDAGTQGVQTMSIQTTSEDETNQQEANLEDLEVPELKEIADERDIEYAKNATKEKMLELLQDEE